MTATTVTIAGNDCTLDGAIEDVTIERVLELTVNSAIVGASHDQLVGTIAALRMILVQLLAPHPPNALKRPLITCPSCNGAKTVAFERGPCEACAGSGEVEAPPSPTSRALATRVLHAVVHHRVAVQDRIKYLVEWKLATPERESETINGQRRAEARLIKAIRDCARPELEDLLRTELESLL
jgi:hypothetical protein